MSASSCPSTSRPGSLRNLVSAANADHDVVEERESSRLAAHQLRFQREQRLQEERGQEMNQKAIQHNSRFSSLHPREALEEYVSTVLIEKALVANKDNPYHTVWNKAEQVKARQSVDHVGSQNGW